MNVQISFTLELGITILQSSINDHRDDKTYKNSNSLRPSESKNSMKNNLRSSSKSSKKHPICESAQPEDENPSQKEELPQRLGSTPDSDFSIPEFFSTSSKTSVNEDHRISKRFTTQNQRTKSKRGDFSEFSSSSLASVNGDRQVSRAMSERLKLRAEVPKITFIREVISPQKTTDRTGGAYFVSEFSRTPNKASVLIDGNCDDHNRDVFYNSSTFGKQMTRVFTEH